MMLSLLKRTRPVGPKIIVCLGQARSASLYRQENVNPPKPKKTKGPKPATKRVTLKNSLLDEAQETPDSKTLLSMIHSRDRKTRAQFTQQLTDYGFCLRPYIHDYFADINNLLHETPNFLQERFIIVAFLGLQSTSQLEDAELIDQKVKSHLEKGKLTHAVHLCRMAKANGSMGMNRVARYLEHNFDRELAFKVIRNMQKWRNTPDEQTKAFLESADTPAQLGLNNPTNSKLKAIYDTSMKNAVTPVQKLTITNSVLEALVRNSTHTDAFEMYYKIPNRGKFSRDYKTYMIMLDLLASLEPIAKGLPRMRKMIWSDIESRADLGEIAIDAELVDAYCRALMKDQDPESYQVILDTVEHYFCKDSSLDRFSRQFPFTSTEVDIVLTSALNCGRYQDAYSMFEVIDSYKHVDLTLENYHNFLRNYSMQKQSNRKRADQIWNMVTDAYEEGNLAVKPTSLTFHLVLRNFLQEKGNAIGPEIVEDMVGTLKELDIPIDDLVLSNYIAMYTRLYNNSLGKSPDRDSGIRALQFVRDNLNAISEVSSLQEHPKRIRTALQHTIQLCGYVRHHPDHVSYKKESGLEWVEELRASVTNLLNTLISNHAEEPTGNPVKQLALSEQEIYHEKQKEISKMYRRRIEYHEIHINKPTIKALKERLRQTMRRTIVEAPPPEVTYVKLDIP